MRTAFFSRATSIAMGSANIINSVQVIADPTPRMATILQGLRVFLRRYSGISSLSTCMLCLFASGYGSVYSSGIIRAVALQAAIAPIANPDQKVFLALRRIANSYLAASIVWAGGALLYVRLSLSVASCFLTLSKLPRLFSGCFDLALSCLFSSGRFCPASFFEVPFPIRRAKSSLYQSLSCIPIA